MTNRKPVVPASSAFNLSADLRRKAVAVAVSAAFVQGAYALPQGGVAEVGSMVITTPTVSSMVITHSTTQNVAGFNSFNTTAGESVRVNFVNGGSAFYKVADPVSFYGSLSANGKIFLSSPGGLLFGAGSLVDVGSIVATTLSMSNADYLAGRYMFTNQGATGSVVNRGTIITATGGYAALIGPNVSNEGIIVAQMGTVALAAGNKVTLDMIGDGLVKVVVDEAALNASVMNKGTLAADGGNVLLTARSANALLDTVINTEGVIRANTISDRNGTIEAKGNDAGTTGGTVKVLGEYVGIGLPGATANIDASGMAGGGTVLIGGNFQGKGPEANSTGTYFGSGSTISADAVASGNGGKVILWSDGATRAYGSLSARGGANGGNGGLVETSGHWLDVGGVSVNTLAPMGANGLWLLDPLNVTIVDGAIAGSTNGVGVTTGGAGLWVPSATGSTVTDGDINSNLLTSDVTITTTNIAAEAGNITVNTGVVITNGFAGTRTFTLTADALTGGIAVNGNAQIGDGV